MSLDGRMVTNWHSIIGQAGTDKDGTACVSFEYGGRSFAISIAADALRRLARFHRSDYCLCVGSLSVARRERARKRRN